MGVHSLLTDGYRYTCYIRDQQPSDSRGSGVVVAGLQNMFILFFVIECILFGLFTCCMLGEQVSKYARV